MQVIDREVIVKTSNELVQVKELTIRDSTGVTIVKLWDEHSKKCENVTIGTTVTITYLKVKEFEIDGGMLTQNINTTISTDNLAAQNLVGFPSCFSIRLAYHVCMVTSSSMKEQKISLFRVLLIFINTTVLHRQ